MRGLLFRLVAMLACATALGASHCSISFFQSDSDFEKIQQAIQLTALLNQIQRASVPPCISSVDHGTALPGPVAASSVDGAPRFFYYHSSATQAYTFRVTVTTGDADLYVYREGTTAQSTVDAFSLNPGTTTDQVVLSVSAGSYRCARVEGVPDAEYTIQVL